MILRRLLWVFAMLALTACSSSSSKVGAQPTLLSEFKQTASFAVRWHAQLGGADNYLLRPAIGKTMIVGASSKGLLTALERANGKQLWQVNTGIVVSGGVGGDGSVWVVGGDKGDVLAYDTTGKPLWKVKVSSEVLSVPQVADGVVVVRSGDGRIAGLAVADGKRLWSYDRATPALVVRSFASVTIQRGIVYAGFAAGKIVALDIKNGSLIWENAVSQPRGNTELDRISDITSNAVVDDEQTCAIAFQGRVACFDSAQGSPLWNRDISSDKGMMLLRKYLYLTDAKGVVMVLDKTTGSTLWKNEQLMLRDTTAPYSFADFVVVGDFEGYLHAMNREDGHFVARIKLDGSPVAGAPLELDEGLLVQTHDGGLYSLTLH
ncbi:MAG: outer membrane protein assembly factor BamB [Gallionella sp.]|nr:outer membrane protein assembly factor BamB [Gallionella sp.]